MKITDFLKDNILYLDGGMGTLLQEQGLGAGELPEALNLSRPDVIKAIHRSYFDAGSNVVNTNTFGANILKFPHDKLDNIIKAAVDNARGAQRESTGTQPKWVALDIGPTGRMLKPYGDLDFEDAVNAFAETVKLGVKYGVDLIFIETMTDSYETKAALLAAKENCSLPVFVSNAYGADGKLMTGASPCAMVAMLEGMGADAVGVNCSLGPEALREVTEQYLEYSSVPVILKPNAGLPKSVDGRTVYDVLPNEFSGQVSELVKKGVRAVGGCCGTTPEYISHTVKACQGISPKEIARKPITCVSSYNHAVIFGEEPVLIGERINPTGKKRFKQALKEGDMDYILKEGINQQEKGVHILDVNVGLPEIDEASMLTDSVCRLQEVVNIPLQIDTSDPVAMQGALRRYNGKAMINSVNGKAESMSAVFPIAKKYGGVVVALTLDENGIPEKAEKRLEIALKILQTAAEYGIDKKDIVFDPLALTVSADGSAARETLRAVEMIRSVTGCYTSLGVSNVSFGLPSRETVTATFFALALERGLSAAIMNPYSEEMMKTYHSYRALAGLDKSCADYIAFASALPQKVTAQIPPANVIDEKKAFSPLQDSIMKGLKEPAALITSQLIKDMEPLTVVQQEIIPALNAVGTDFEKNKIYLPQLLMSAEAAKCAFGVIKKALEGKPADTKCPFVLATVKGDIHDIGKNIVKLLLENYGFAVSDLGKDVAPEDIVSETIRLKAPLVGLSALMTTTVPAMEETIKLLRQKAPWCKIIVGGAVLTQEYADAIGADKYAADAMETVRYAQEINSLLEG